MKLVDTSVAVDHLCGHPAAMELLTELLAAGEELVSSELVRFELLVGAREEDREALERFFEALVWVPVTEEVVRAAGEYARTYRATHRGIEAIDYLLAGTCAVLGAELLTTKLRHFPMLVGLERPY